MKVEIVDIDEIEDVIIEYAKGDFSKRMSLSESKENRDVIATGINMLGEELERTTISSDYFGSIYNAVQDILIVIAPDSTISDINVAAQNKLQIQKENVIGKPLEYLVKINRLDRNALKYIVEDKSVLSQIESKCGDGEGNDFPVICSSSKLIDRRNVEKGYLIIAKDISVEKNNETEKLRAIVTAQENERNKLSIDLHDSLGQELNVVKTYLDTIGDLDPNKINLKTAFEKCKSILNDSILSICDMSFDLMPQALKMGDLRMAIAELASKLEPIIPVEYNFNSDTSFLSKEEELYVYRIFQEFTQNSLKHAKATLISLSINTKGEKIEFRLEDNGIGYEIDEVDLGNGLNNIQSRLAVLKADFNIESTKNTGTSLNFTIRK